MNAPPSTPQDPTAPPVPGAGLPPGGQETFGRYLRQERELRGIGLEQVAEQTRIGIGKLKALEQDDAARLPARVFLHGYIRAYAQAIGLDADDAVLRYEERCPNPEESEAALATRRRPRRRAALTWAAGLLAAVLVIWLLNRC